MYSMLSLKGVESEENGNIAKSLALQKHFCRAIFCIAKISFTLSHQDLYIYFVSLI